MVDAVKKRTAKDIVAEIELETAEQSAANLKDLIRATTQMMNERKTWQNRRQKEIDALKEVQVEAVKLFDEGKFDEDAQKESRHRVLKIKIGGGRPMTDEQRAEAVERFKNRYRHRHEETSDND